MRALSFYLVLTAAVLAGEEPNRPRVFAIENARIVPVSSAPIERGVIVLRDGLIEAVGSSAEIPADAWVIDGLGLTAYPGFIDAMSSLGMPEPKGNGGPRSSGPQDRPATTPWTTGAEVFQPPKDAVKAWRDGGFTTAALAPRNGIFPGRTSLVSLGDDESRRIIDPATALIVRLPDGPQGYVGYPASPMGRTAYVRQIFLDARHAAETWAMYNANPAGLERPPFDRTLAPLQQTLSAGRPVLYPADDALHARRALAFEALGERIVVYGGRGFHAAGVAAEIAAAGTQVLLDVAWPEAPRDPDPEEEPTLRELERWKRAPESAQALSEAGVAFGLYSSEVRDPKTFLDGVRKAVAAGWPADRAVRALTLDAARIHSADAVLGSLEAGTIANVVLFRGDPFAEKIEPEIVFIDGVMVRNEPAQGGAEEPEEEKE